MILNYIEFLTENKMIDPGTVLKLKFSDIDGIHITKCKILGYGWSVDRKPIYYELEVLESNSDKYNVGANFILPFDFNISSLPFIYNKSYFTSTSTNGYFSSFIEITPVSSFMQI